MLRQRVEQMRQPLQLLRGLRHTEILQILPDKDIR
jgi:hypothetical protein